MSELTIREMGQDEDFSAWFSELLEQEDATTGSAGAIDEHYLILSNEIGVAHLVDVVVLPQERHRGHAHRLLAAFEERATEAGGHTAEFWTDDQRSEGLLGALGWRRIFQREDYIGHRAWSLMEKRLGGDPR
jgi:ribosomal protein S18 acetylase RimI-like enzyme